MSQRTEKVESLVRQTVAQALMQSLAADSARVTVTGVDVSPDLKQATVWIGVVGNDKQTKALWEQIEAAKSETQRAVNKTMTTKYVPHLNFRQDAGGEYAAHIDSIIRDL